jgi:hypothetical protein
LFLREHRASSCSAALFQVVWTKRERTLVVLAAFRKGGRVLSVFAGERPNFRSHRERCF